MSEATRVKDWETLQKRARLLIASAAVAYATLARWIGDLGDLGRHRHKNGCPARTVNHSGAATRYMRSRDT